LTRIHFHARFKSLLYIYTGGRMGRNRKKEKKAEKAAEKAAAAAAVAVDTSQSGGSGVVNGRVPSAADAIRLVAAAAAAKKASETKAGGGGKNDSAAASSSGAAGRRDDYFDGELSDCARGMCRHGPLVTKGARDSE
jgi:hypothetical protein